MVDEDEKILEEEKGFHKKALRIVREGFGKITSWKTDVSKKAGEIASVDVGAAMSKWSDKNIPTFKRGAKAGAGLVGAAAAGATRPTFVMLIISMILYVYDAAFTNFYRVGLNPIYWVTVPTFWLYFIFALIVIMAFKMNSEMSEKEVALF